MSILPRLSTLPELKLRAFKTAALYIMVGATWILFSDYLLYFIINGAAQLPVLQTLKGWFFMVITGAALFALVYRDLRQMHLFEISLKESESKYRMLSDSITDLFFALDRDLRFTYWNKAMQELTGMPALKAIGKSMADVLPATVGTIYDKNFKAAIETKEPHNFIGEFVNGGDKRYLDVTAYPSGSGGLSVLARDITERLRTRRQLEETLQQMRLMLEDTVTVLAEVAEKRDPTMAGHQQQVGALAAAIAREMGLSSDRIESVRIAGVLHDIGKISVPSELLSRPGPLNESEYRIVKIYPEVSYEILKDIRFPWPVAEIVLQHQEKLNGTGYPEGLKDGQIMLEARILRVADYVVAKSTHRPYRPTIGTEKSLQELENNSGILYDPDVVSACLRLFRQKLFILKGPLIHA